MRRRSHEKITLYHKKLKCPGTLRNQAQIPWALDDGVGTMMPVMQSDIHLQRGNTVLIIDAKYYSHTTQVQFDKHTLHSNNLYQMHGSQISVKTLDLNLPFTEIAVQMDRIVESHFAGVIKAD